VSSSHLVSDLPKPVHRARNEKKDESAFSPGLSLPRYTTESGLTQRSRPHPPAEQTKERCNCLSATIPVTSDPDQELVTACQNGSRQAFNTLVVRHKDRLYSVAARLVGEHGEAEDIAQETFLRAYQKIGEFRGASQFSTWLYRICHNLCLNHLHKKKQEIADDTITEILPDPSAGACEQLIGHEQRQVIQHALSRLKHEFREVIILYHAEHLPYEEIADVLDLPVGTVRSRLHRGRGELKDLLRPYFIREAASKTT
jgi:RNA polymerase sigma-70 factor, ECF subfamily